MPDIHDFEPLWGEWYAVKLLGQGAFGKVYLAKKTELGKEYYSAIKYIQIPIDTRQTDELYSEGLVTDHETVNHYYEQVLQSLMAEISINYQLKGTTNIVSYEEHKIIPRTGEPGYDIFIKMELLTSLAEHIRSSRITVGDVIRLGRDICTALTVLQREKIVHRDVKPANIFLHGSGHFKLGDFGVARTMEKTISSMSVKGTFAFMAPEVARGGDGDYRVDIYSLGLVLYKLLNGNRGPFLPPPPAAVTYDSNNLAQRRRIQGETLPPPAMADEALSAIILKACAYRPEDRYQDAAHFHGALAEYEAAAPLERLKTAVININREKKPATEDELPFFPPAGGDARMAKARRLADILAPPRDEGGDVTELFLQDEEEENYARGPGKYPPQAPTPAAIYPVRKEQTEKKDRRKIWPVFLGAAAVFAAAMLVLGMLWGRTSNNAASHTPTPSLSTALSEPSSASAPSASAPPVSASPAQLGVTLADDGMTAYIRAELGLAPEDKITAEMLEQIEALRMGAETGLTITTLKDLKHLPNLKVLDLSGQQPDQFMPLTELEALVSLNLGGCTLGEDGFLSRLPVGLQNLDLRDTGLTSLDFAGRLERLVELNISGNNVADLTPLAELTQLTILVADGNPVSDWSAADGIPSVSGRPQEAAVEQTSATPEPSGVSRPSAVPSRTPGPSRTPEPVSTPDSPLPEVAVSGITLSRSSALLDVGGGISLSATVSPANATDVWVSWSSSNSAVATVDDTGRVTAVGPGTAVISASCGGLSASCTVSVG